MNNLLIKHSLAELNKLSLPNFVYNKAYKKMLINKSNPEVSVIIPTYNRISMLEEALASVVSQEFDSTIEIIVVDDNSQDGTSQIISQKYPYVRLIRLEQNQGSYVARNRGLLVAKGKYIAFLDSDDFWQTNYLKSQITALAGKERCFCVSAVVMWDIVKDQKKTKFPKPNLVKFISPIHQLLVGKNFIATPSSVVFPRQVFDEVGLFEETFRVGGDCELYTRCLIAGYQPIFTELPVATWRRHDKDHLTDPRNLKIRKKGRLARLDKLSPLLEKRDDIPPIRRLRAETYRYFASLYFQNRYFLCWLISSIESAYNASPGYALFNMIRDVIRFT